MAEAAGDHARSCARLADAFPQLAAASARLADDRVLASAVEVAASAGGVTAEATFGLGNAALDQPPLFELHCLTKPLVAWTLLEVASRHGFEAARPIRTLLPTAAIDDRVTVATICTHESRLAFPSALDWIATPPDVRPGVEELVQEPSGSWYSEVGAWIVAAALIERLEGRPATEVVADVVARCEADAFIGKAIPPGRTVVPPIAGLPDRVLPMLHVRHPTFHRRLGPEFGGFGSMPGYLRFLEQVSARLAGRPSALDVADDVIEATGATGGIGPNATWNRPAGFRWGFVDAATPSEPGRAGALSMFAGIASAACFVDPDRQRHLAFATDGASFDPADHRFVRGALIEAFVEDCAEGYG